MQQKDENEGEANRLPALDDTFAKGGPPGGGGFFLSISSYQTPEFLISRLFRVRFLVSDQAKRPNFSAPSARMMAVSQNGQIFIRAEGADDGDFWFRGVGLVSGFRRLSSNTSDPRFLVFRPPFGAPRYIAVFSLSWC
jgi:hypothetical protein